MSRAPDVVIDCHIDDVFAFVADLTHAPRWMAGVVSAEQIAGDGPGLGAMYDVARRIRGRQRRAAMVCVEWDPPRRIAWRAEEAEVRYEFESVWTATRVIALSGTSRDLRGLCRVLEGRR